MNIPELSRIVRERTEGDGHYDGCELVHGWCAAARAFDEIERLQLEVARLRTLIGNHRGGASLKLKFQEEKKS